MRSNKKAILYDYILDRLIEGRFKFGEPILVKQLSAETGASSQPILAALMALSVDGFVNIIPQVGCEVINPTPRDIADFYRFFARTEGLLAELAATRWTKAQLAALKSANSMIRADLADSGGERYQELNRVFHRIFHEMAGSPLLDSRQSSIFAMSDFMIMQTIGFRPRVNDAAIEHDEIIAAIEARSAVKARKSAEKHINAVAKVVIAAAQK
jgi:DNA-binding GntR family transcriptional regulator